MIKFIYPEDKIYIFVDGPGFFMSIRHLNIVVDYGRLLDFFGSMGRLVGASYATTVTDDEDSVALRSLLDWLDYNGWNTIVKDAKFTLDGAGEKKFINNSNIELAMDIVKSSRFLDHIILFSGNRDFLPVVEYVRQQGVRVSLASTTKSKPRFLHDDLRRSVDFFIELEEIENFISRRVG